MRPRIGLHPSRCDRQLGKRFGDEAYAMEEPIAELGSAYTMAGLELELTPRRDHAAYIDSWLRVLRSDKQAIFTAALQAQKAADWMVKRSGQTPVLHGGGGMTGRYLIYTPVQSAPNEKRFDAAWRRFAEIISESGRTRLQRPVESGGHQTACPGNGKRPTETTETNWVTRCVPAPPIPVQQCR
jgi:hypothetical protein